VTLFWQLAAVGGLALLAYFFERAASTSGHVVWTMAPLTGLALICVILLALAASVAAITVVLERAGLRSRAVLGCLKFTPLVSLITVIGAFIAQLIVMAAFYRDQLGYVLETLTREPGMIGTTLMGYILALTVPTLVAQVLGYGVMALYGKWRRRRARWETVQPLGQEEEKETWAVRHPTWAGVLTAFAVAVPLCLVSVEIITNYIYEPQAFRPWTWPYLFLYVPLALGMFCERFASVLRQSQFGYSPRRALPGALWQPLVWLAMFTASCWVFNICMWPYSWTAYLKMALLLAGIESLLTGLAAVGGWAVGAWVVARRRMAEQDASAPCPSGNGGEETPR
jgi:hypothetical protein